MVLVHKQVKMEPHTLGPMMVVIVTPIPMALSILKIARAISPINLPMVLPNNGTPMVPGVKHHQTVTAKYITQMVQTKSPTMMALQRKHFWMGQKFGKIWRA
ncbi:MAG: hypothetical protein QF595_10700 [Dehalococcoidia bacterium]|jgi:hypothetical protein|nr:hypothetical protein [Dehalococcoidia bacterium]